MMNKKIFIPVVVFICQTLLSVCLYQLIKVIYETIYGLDHILGIYKNEGENIPFLNLSQYVRELALFYAIFFIVLGIIPFFFKNNIASKYLALLAIDTAILVLSLLLLLGLYLFHISPVIWKT